MNLIWLKKQPAFLWGLVALLGIGAFVFCVVHVPKNIAEEKNEIVQTAVPAPDAVQPPSRKTVHIVKEGETLSAIAAQYNLDVDTLEGANPDLKADLHPGDQLLILPEKGALHTVRNGDTLWWIANAYHAEMAAILKANGKTGEELAIGETLFVPGGKKPKETDRLVARAETAVSRGSSSRFLWPTEGELTSGFGHRWGRNHDGIDLANEIGTPVRASRAGRVSYSGWLSGYGRTVMIEHEQGYTTVYGHLSESFVAEGQYVKAGQRIAAMGNTGYSTGPHLHFEVRKNGTPINPFNVLP